MNQSSKSKDYQVLARKYRPSKLSELIGQDVLVRTLTHAIEGKRIPHAFIMTGIRGVGKTSTARIIARSLICSGADGAQENPTIDPCGECENCRAVAEDRHVDILELDAASRTGVGDIREIIESVNYKPVMARYKIYIIDEVHMLSKSAFNALLKTLEEPPEHTKFIFATTEIRKVPVTILSRCMRFDLPRVDSEILQKHLAYICDQESAKVDPGALAVIANAAEGSVRDALSLLDQAISMGDEDVFVSHDDVHHMLGIADRSQLFSLFEHVSKGEVKEAIQQLRTLYHSGADPIMVLQDLLELSHFITQCKIVPGKHDDPATPEAERLQARAMADDLSIPFLTRVWQMLIKGISEAKVAPHSLQAAEMILIRIAYASNLPSPGDLVRDLKKGQSDAATMRNPANKEPQRSVASGEVAEASGHTEAIKNNLEAKPSEKVVESQPSPQSFEELVALFEQNGEVFINRYLQESSLIKFDAAAHRVEVRPAPSCPADFIGQVSRLLTEWTGKRWVAIVSNEKGAKPLRATAEDELESRIVAAKNDPMVLKALELFPGSEIVSVLPLEEESESEYPHEATSAAQNGN